jgi:hypothetical protein
MIRSRTSSGSAAIASLLRSTEPQCRPKTWERAALCWKKAGHVAGGSRKLRLAKEGPSLPAQLASHGRKQDTPLCGGHSWGHVCCGKASRVTLSGVGARVLRSCVASPRALLGGSCSARGDRVQRCPTFHLRIEHFQGSAAGVNLIVIGEIGKAPDDAEQVLVPGASPDPSHCRCGAAN